MVHYSATSYLSRYLPQCHDYALINADLQCEDPAFLKFTALIRVGWRDKQDMKKWINEFSKLTRSDWIQRDMSDWKSFKYTGAFSGKYVCQHSSHGKKEDSVRDSNCRAEIFFNFVRDPGARKRRRVGDMNAGELVMRESDMDLWRKGLRYSVRINFNHTHNLESADGLRMLRSKVDDIYFALFTAGIEPNEAYEIFQRMNRECFQDPINKANASLNPDIEHIQYLHKRYIGAFVPADYDSQLKAIENALIDHYECSGVTVIFSKEPLVVAVATPLMQRASQLSTCADAIFIDSTPAYDSHNHFVTFLFTSTCAGAIPIGCFITRDLTQSSLVEGFNLLKAHFGANSFAGCGFPKYIMAGQESHALASALAMVWPNSELKVNQFQKLQNFWKWLLATENGISSSDCGEIMLIFKNLLNSVDDKQAERQYSQISALPIGAGYPQLVEHLGQLWKDKKMWCLAFRQESIRSGYIYMLSEASVRSYIEVFESRRPAATLIGLITKIIAECNAHYSEKLMNYALGRNSEYGRQAHSIVRNSKTLRNEEQNAACSSMDSNDRGSVCLVTDGLNQDGVEIRYLVNVSAGVCECHSSQTTFYCQHLDAAQTHLNCNVPSSDLTIQPELDKKERTLLLQLATGSSCSRSLFAPWDVVMSEESMEIYTDDADNIAQEILVDSSNSDQLHNYVIDKDNREDEENVKFYAASTPSTSAINGNTQTEDQPNKSTSHPKISATQYTKNKAEEKVVEITNRFSKRLFDILQQSLASNLEDGTKTIELAEQACVKLEKTRSVKAFQRFFTGVIDGNVSHTPCTSQVPPYQSLSPRKRRISEQKEVNEEDEFIIVEDNLQDADIQITTVAHTM